MQSDRERPLQEECVSVSVKECEVLIDYWRKRIDWIGDSQFLPHNVTPPGKVSIHWRRAFSGALSLIMILILP